MDTNRRAFRLVASCPDRVGILAKVASPDTIVLARYMQILPSWLCRKFRYRVINNKTIVFN